MCASSTYTVVEEQLKFDEGVFSTNLGSPNGPKETELAVLVRPAADCRRAPTAIGDGASPEQGIVWLDLVSGTKNPAGLCTKNLANTVELHEKSGIICGSEPTPRTG